MVLHGGGGPPALSRAVGGSGHRAVSSGMAGDHGTEHSAASNTVTKVAEVFLTAGHAFQKLGDLALQLHSTPQSDEHMKWSERDIDALKDSLTRFAHDLDNISDSVQARVTKHIKVDLKRRQMTGEDSVGGRAMSPAAKQPRGTPSGVSGSGGKRFGMHAAPGRPKLVQQTPSGAVESPMRQGGGYYMHDDHPDVGAPSSF